MASVNLKVTSSIIYKVIRYALYYCTFLCSCSKWRIRVIKVQFEALGETHTYTCMETIVSQVCHAWRFLFIYKLIHYVLKNIFKSHPSMIYYINLNTNDRMSVYLYLKIIVIFHDYSDDNCLLKFIAFKFQGHDVMYHSTNSNYSWMIVICSCMWYVITSHSCMLWDKNSPCKY